MRRARPERQVQNLGRKPGGGAHSPRRGANDPDGPALRLLGVPHGDAEAHGAGTGSANSSTGRRGELMCIVVVVVVANVCAV